MVVLAGVVTANDEGAESMCQSLLRANFAGPVGISGSGFADVIVIILSGNQATVLLWRREFYVKFWFSCLETC